MQYVNPTFSTLTSNGRLSDIEYEISVGLRCPKCKALSSGEHASKWCTVTRDSAITWDTFKELSND